MAKIDSAALRTHIRQQVLSRVGDKDCDWRKYYGGIVVLRGFLGQPWIDRHLASSNRNPYFEDRPSAPFGQFSHVDRVVELADLLINLYEIHGFDRILNELKTADVESIIAELQGAAFLRRSGIRFRFVRPQSRRREDYDVEFTLDGFTIAAEMKARIEGTVPSAERIRTTLKRAAKRQLPDNKPGVLFLKIPESWLSSRELKRIVDEGLGRLFRDYRRVTAVIFHWDEWRRLNSSGGVRLSRFRAEYNPHGRMKLPTLDQALKGWPPEPGSWHSLADIVCDGADLGLTVMTLLDMAERRSEPEVIADGVEYVGVVYVGSIARLRAVASTAITTVIDFDCDHFELFDGSDTAMSADISVGNGPVNTFRIVRGPRPSSWQIQISDRVYDESLLCDDHGTIHSTLISEKTRAALNRGEIDSQDVLNADGFVTQLREIFAALRAEQDLTRDAHFLSRLCVSYYEGDPGVRIFSCKYLKPEVRV